VAEHVATSREDTLAFSTFSKDACTQIRSNNPANS